MSRATGKAKGVGLYHAVYAHEGFEEAATAPLELVQSAQRREPGKRRILFLDIDGHRDRQGRYDRDMLELQTAFMTEFLMPFLAEAHLPGGVHVVKDVPRVVGFRWDLRDESCPQVPTAAGSRAGRDRP